MKSDVRNRLVLPIVIPIGILLLIALVLFGFSRILLSVTPDAATGIALVVAATILIAAAVAASRTRVREATIGGLLGTVAGVAMLVGGIAIVAIGPAKEAAKPFDATLVAPAKASIDGYAQTSLSFPAARPVNLTFENEESGQTHNMVIAAGTDQKAPAVFTGALVPGPGTKVYAIKPLQPGSYFYFCQVHPTTMTGHLTVAPEPAGAPGGGGGGGLTVTAQNVQFNTSKITLPDQPSTLTFRNLDPGTMHNIGIYEDQAYTKEAFKGAVITGVDTTTYTIQALQPGTYYFKCDIHPTMTGTVEVTRAAGGGGGSPSSSSSAGSGAPSAAPGASA
jgi:plastocyanin